MTITSTTNRVSYAGDGGTTAFSFPHRFLTDADLTVILVVDSTGVETTQTITTDYTVSGAGAASGGTVTMNSAPATGETLVIINDPDLKQGYDPEDGSALGADSLETAVDKLTILAQRTRTLITRAFRLSDGDTSGASLELPAPTALNLVRWDSNGTKLENVELTDASAVAIAEDRILGRLLGGTTKDLTPEEVRRLLGDSEHATDSGTDTYVSATNTTPPADGVKITRDFQSANTTTTPTLDAKTMTTRDGSALWAGAVSGPHDLKRDQTADTYLVLEPNPSVQRDPTRAASATQKGDVELATSAETDTGTDTGRAITPAGGEATYLKRAATSSDPALAFDTWRTPNANRPVLIAVEVQVQTDGTTSATIDINVDESGGTTVDYSLRAATADSDAGTGADVIQTTTTIIPAGGSYRVANNTDPNEVNSVRDIREFTL